MKLSYYILTLLLLWEANFSAQSTKFDNLTNLQNQFIQLYQSAEYSKAIEIGLQVKTMQDSIIGKNDLNYAMTLGFLAYCYDKQIEYEKAIEYENQELEIIMKIKGVKSPEYANGLDYLSRYYSHAGNCKAAESSELFSVNIFKELYGEQDDRYIQPFFRLSVIYSSCLHDYNKAIQIEKNIIEILKNSNKNYTLEYTKILDVIALNLNDIGQYTQSIDYINESLVIKSKIVGVEHPDYLSSMDNLALSYSCMGDYGKAIEILKLIKQIQIQNSNQNTSDFLRTIKGLADYYNNNLEYNESIRECKFAIKLMTGSDNKSRLEYAEILDKLSRAYFGLNNNLKFIELKEESLEIKKSILGENHPDYINSLDDQILNYISIGEYETASIKVQKAIELKKLVMGVNSYGYAVSLTNYANILLFTGRFEDANMNATEAIKILGNNPYVILSLNILASSNFNLSNYYKSIEYYNQIIEITKNQKNTSQPFFSSILKSIAESYAALNDIPKSIDYYNQSKSVIEELIKEKFNLMSDKERDLFWSIENGFYERIYPSFCYKYHLQEPSISTFAYDNTLFSKGLLLNTSLQIQNTILQSRDSILIGTWNNLHDLKRQLNILQSKPLAQQGDLSVMEAKADSLDKVLNQKSQLYKQNQSDMQVKWKDVQKNLKLDEAAIEFVSFDYYNKHYTDSTMYCALVLKKNSPYPEMILLFEEKQLDSLFKRSSSNVNQLYTYRRVSDSIIDIAERRLNYGSKLYNLLWKPLEASLKNIKTVYYAPSGKLNQVAFAAIPVDSTSFLSDKYNLHQLTSTRQVIHKNEQDKQTAKIHKAALFGGIDYNLNDKQFAQVQTNTYYPNLNFTSEEVTGIAKEFNKEGLTEQLFTRASASKAAFKKLNGTNTDIIHIATHGFYKPIEETKPKDFNSLSFDNDRRDVVVHNPLSRSGLAFAGANHAWRVDSIPDNWEDGILTSQEISQLNLTHTDLVVLSACETALGDIKGSEGVFGLQRAFKMAGIQTLIMSLWRVDDKATSELMQNFYKYWLGGMTKHDAFKKAQNDIRTKIDANGKKIYSNPYYWAAFIMVD